MTKMRLTTLNLDQECLDILGSKKNKSLHVRRVLKEHEEVAEVLEETEGYLEMNRVNYRTLVEAIVHAYACGWTVEGLLTDLLEETDFQVSRYQTNGHLIAAIRQAVSRRGKA